MKSYTLASIPMSQPRSVIDDASSLLSSAISSPFSFLSGLAGGERLKSTPEAVFDGEIDLNYDQILEQDRGEEGEVDDSLERHRQVRVLAIDVKENLGEHAKLRRKWQVISLRAVPAQRTV